MMTEKTHLPTLFFLAGGNLWSSGGQTGESR